MAKRRPRHEESPQTKTADLHGYLLEDAPDQRSEAVSGIFEQCRELIGSITAQLLRSRFHQLAEDTIQDAWSDCLSELQARREEFLKVRGERPVLREMAVAVTMRAVWRLEMRARRERQRLASAETEEPYSAPELEAVSSLSAIDFHRIFLSAWERLLALSSSEDQIVLNDVGPLAFFADDWASVTTPLVPGGTPQRTMTTVVLERRRAARAIVDGILERELRLEPKIRQRFLRTLLPG
jgi:hypothetical protein